MRARWGPENWARILGGGGGAGLSWAVALWEMPWRDHCSFFPKGLGGSSLAPCPLGGSRVVSWGSRGPCVCVRCCVTWLECWSCA